MSWKARVHPELKPLLRKVPNVTLGPFVRRGFRMLMSAAPAGAPSGGVTMKRVALGDQRVIVFTPPGESRPRPALLWLHGGGRIVGRPETETWHASRWAEELGMVVVAASYRLSPEHVFPAPLDDIHAAWGWIQEHADELGVDPTRVAVGGESGRATWAWRLARPTSPSTPRRRGGRIYEDAGVRVELYLIEGGFHGIFAVGRDEPPMLAMRESMDMFLRETLGL